MPDAKLDRAGFDALARRAGLRLTATQAAELYAAWGTLEALCERLHAPLPAAAEPATIYACASKAP